MNGPITSPPVDANAGRWMLLALGASTMTTQIVMLREFMTVVAGNELIIGLVLASWMGLTGFGAWTARFRPFTERRHTSPVPFIIVLALLPPLTVSALRLLRNVVFTPGSLLGVSETLMTAVLLFLPYCVLSGLTFVILAGALSTGHGAWQIGNAYGWEATGGGIAGALVSVFLVSMMKTMTILLLLSAFVCLVLFVVERRQGIRWALGIIGIGAVGTTLFVPVDDWTKGFLFPDQQLLENRDTPYGNLAVTRQAAQVNFYEDGMLLFSTDDVVQNEESVHFAMLQRRNVARALVISGGVSGRISELLKYPLTGIDYLELDPAVLELGSKYTSELSDPRVTAIPEDPRIYIRRTHRRYGMVLVNLPDPSTALLNRVYTDEFFADVAKILDDSGVVSISLMEEVEYRGKEARSLGSVLVNTLRKHFTNVLIVPGGRDYYLASDAPLRIDVAAMSRERRLRTLYVNEDYLSDTMLRERSNLLMEETDKAAGINTDFVPASYYRYMQFWLSAAGAGAWWLAALGFLLIALLIVTLPPVPFGMLTIGWAASSLEVLLLVAFQVIFGHVYRLAGLLIALFMSGLAVGALFTERQRNWSGRKAFFTALCAMAVVCFALPSSFSLVRSVMTVRWISLALFLAAMPAIGIITGATFTISTRMVSGATAHVGSLLYSVDLVGAAAGALLTAAYIIPVVGIMNTSYLTGALVVAGVALSAFRLRSPR